jgi:hypothetical protein
MTQRFECLRRHLMTMFLLESIIGVGVALTRRRLIWILLLQILIIHGFELIELLQLRTFFRISEKLETHVCNNLSLGKV